MLLLARGIIVFLLAIAGAVGCRPAETFRGYDGSASIGAGGSGGIAIGVGSGGSDFDAGQGTGTGGDGGSGGDPGGAAGSGGSGSGGAAGSGGSGGVLPGTGGTGGRVDAGTDRGVDTGVDRGDTRDVPVDQPPEPRPEPPPDVAPDRPIDVRREVLPSQNGCLRMNWTFTVNYVCDTLLCDGQTAPNKDSEGAIDGMLNTRYTTGRLQGSPPDDEMVTLNFGATVTLGGITSFTSSVDDGPAAYRLEYSTDGTVFRRFIPDLAGPGTENLTITFPPTAMRAIRIIQTGSKPGNWWSIHELTPNNCTPN